MTLSYRPHGAWETRFGDGKGVNVGIEDYGKVASAPFYQPMFDALRAAGYTLDRNVRVAGYDARLTPDLGGFLERTQRLIEDTYRDNGDRPVHLVGHSNGPLYAQYLLTHTSQAWKDKYIHGFTPIAGNLPGQGSVYPLVFTGLNVQDFSFPTTPENARSSSLMLLSAPSSYMSMGDPRVFDSRETVVEDLDRKDVHALGLSCAVHGCRPADGARACRALHRLRAVHRPGGLSERRRVRREGVRHRHRRRNRATRPLARPAAGRLDAVLHPRRRHQPRRHHQRSRRGVERDALLALQPHRQPGRRPLLTAEQPERARPAHRRCERSPLELQLTDRPREGQRARGPPDVADMDALKAAMETPGAAEAMAYDGVVPETLVMLVKA